MSRRYSVGVVTAYGAAKAGGYTGTYSQFCEDLADLGDNIAEVREARIEVDANKTAAQQAQEGAETAQGAAEDAAESVSQSAAQIEQNRQDIDDLKSAVDQKAPAIYEIASGAIASFEDGADGMPIKALTVNIEPVQEGNGDPSPENVRPITGWTGCNVTRAGKNLLSEIEQGTISTSGPEPANNRCRTKWDSPIAAPAGTTFVITGNATNGTFNAYIGVYADAETTTRLASSGRLASGESYTIPSGGAFIRITFRVFENSNVTPSNFANVQLELGSATDYEPYQGNTYTITFPTEAGTVYGGTLDVTNGVLTVDRAMVDLGSLAWSYNVSYERFTSISLSAFIKRPSANFEIANLLCEIYSARAITNFSENNIIGAAISGNIQVKDTRYSSVDDFIQVVTGLKLVYELATPVLYQLTPQEVTTLLGVNNIWADCGGVSVEYPADTKLYIERINAPTDDDMTADTQIDNGKYFLIGNTLYLSTTVIPAGDTIIPGTNCTKTNLAAALNALNA